MTTSELIREHIRIERENAEKIRAFLSQEAQKDAPRADTRN